MATRRQIYAVYRGEENLGDGTGRRISKETQCERKNDLLFGNRRPT